LSEDRAGAGLGGSRSAETSTARAPAHPARSGRDRIIHHDHALLRRGLNTVGRKAVWVRVPPSPALWSRGGGAS
jgi:hypothetical protein